MRICKSASPTFLAILLLASAFAVGGQTAAPLALTADELREKTSAASNKNAWKYRAGDDPNWAHPAFDDADWQTLPDTTGNLHQTAADWRGTGWFRLRFRTDESLADQTLGMGIAYTLAATEVYLDGRLIRRSGAISDDPQTARFVNETGTPFAATVGAAGEHTLAVRYQSANRQPDTVFGRWINALHNGDGFVHAFSDLNRAAARRELSQRSFVAVSIIRVGVFLAVGALFLLLFWFYPPQRANLYFGIYAFLYAANDFSIFLQNASGAEIDLTEFAAYRILSRLLFFAYSTAFVMFLYQAFLPRAPRFAGVGLLLWGVTNASALLLPNSGAGNAIFGAMTIVYTAECVRVMVVAVRGKSVGAWIVALGVLTALIGPVRYLYVAAGLTIPNDTDRYLQYIFSYGMMTAVSIYLARQFAGTNRNLAAQLAQVRELSAREITRERHAAELRLERERERAENERRAQELEEAKRLQLSLLPKKLPDLPGLEIAAYMKTASEVGGDYYDFHVAADGTLTVAVGDATGHGLKAGSVVTATKSLFNAFAADENIPAIFSRTSDALKRMNLRGLFMAMAMLKIKDGRLTISQAGMPSALIYRAASGAVEEVVIRALPLGGLSKSVYDEKQFDLAAGDLVVVMSDGFPEMFDPAGEMLGFGKAAQILPQVAERSAQEVINRLIEAGEDWAGGRPPDDDVTFVVLKFKP